MMRALRARARLAARRFRRPFRLALEDPHAPVSFDLDRASKTLLVAFGGMQGQLGMPPFEFFKASGDIPVKRLFVRDLRQAWYHRGLPGHGDRLEDVAAWLRELVAGNGVERLVMAGNSAGGYAALLFGALVEADVVLCFAPQTVIDLEVLAAMGDDRWDDQLRDLTATGVIEQRFADLSLALPRARTGATRFELYFDETFDADRQHAERLGSVEGVELHRLQGGAHSIARDMRESGQLDLVLQRALLPGGQA